MTNEHQSDSSTDSGLTKPKYLFVIKGSLMRNHLCAITRTITEFIQNDNQSVLIINLPEYCELEVKAINHDGLSELPEVIVRYEDPASDQDKA